MAEYPALPLFTDAFIGDTTHLTAAQTGAYLMLLMIAWRTSDCSIPNDDKILARYARMDLRTWKQNKDTILSFWRLDDDQKFRQRRLLDERKYVDDKKIKNSTNSKSRWLKNKKTDDADALPESSQNDPNPTHTPLSKNIIPITTTSLIATCEPSGSEVVVEGKSFEGRCYAAITGVFPSLMAKSMIPLSQWRIMGFSFENVQLALETVKNQGTTPDGFGYFTPVITKIINASGIKKNSAMPEAEETYEQYCSRLGLTPEYGEQAHA